MGCEFKYLGCVFDKSGKDDAEFCRKVVRGRKVAGPAKGVWGEGDVQLVCSIGWLWKRWIDTVKDSLKEKRFRCQASK